MKKEYNVEVEVKKSRRITFRKDDARINRPWDWYDEDDIESNEYFDSFEEAYADAQKAIA